MLLLEIRTYDNNKIIFKTKHSSIHFNSVERKFKHKDNVN